MKGICYIISACCKEECRAIKKGTSDIIIAADKGYEVLLRNGIEPDMVLGDFDSLKYVPNHKNTIVHPAKKAATDTFLSVEKGFDLGFRNFVILGGIGGKRIDHTIANMQTLVHIAKNGGRGALLGQGTVMTAIHNGRAELPAKKRGFVSVFCMGDKALGVSINSLKYELNNSEIFNSDPLGVSNEFIGKTDAYASVKNGDILIMWHEKAEKILSDRRYLSLFKL